MDSINIRKVLIHAPAVKETHPSENETPLVSIIIPTYNRAHTLDRALRSVFAQTYPHYEIIVVDDASTDGTAEWTSKTYPKIRLVRLPVNRGISTARNEGAKIARGSLLAFLDSDDEWLPEYLSEHVQALLQHSEAELSSCGFINREPYESDRESHYTHKPEYPTLIHRLLLEIAFVKTFIIIRTNSWKRLGGFDERLRNCEDREFYIRLLLSGGFLLYVPRVLATRHVSSDSVSWDMCHWAKYAMRLLNIFYALPDSQPYRSIEVKARRMVCLKLIHGFMHKQLNRPRKLRLFLAILRCSGQYRKFLTPNDFWTIPGIKNIGTLSISKGCVYIMTANLAILKGYDRLFKRT